MSKTKKMTFNMVAAKMPKPETIDIAIDWMDNATISVQKYLSVEEAVSFVNETVASCFDVETGNYSPEMLDFVVKVNTLVCYAGFDAPKDLKKAYRVVYETNLVRLVLAEIDNVQYGMLLNTIEAKLKYMVDASIAAASKQINDAMTELNHIMENGTSAMEVMQSPEFSEMMQRMSNLANIDSKPAELSDTNVVDMYAHAPKIRVLDHE